MSRENRIFKKGGGFLRNEKKKGFNSLGSKPKLNREKKEKKKSKSEEN